jgi:hypothetical protein
VLTSYVLSQNYRNPFNPSTTIKFNLPEARDITLKVFNILGEEVVTLVSGRLTASSYSYNWSRSSGIASGIYFYRLEREGYVKTKKMILMKQIISSECSLAKIQQSKIPIIKNPHKAGFLLEWHLPELNGGHTDFQSVALPTELRCQPNSVKNLIPTNF